LFYSRRIARQPQGSVPDDALASDVPAAARLLGAAKVSGRVGASSLGSLSAVTGGATARYVDASGVRRVLPVEPITQYAVARAQRDFGDGRNAIGVMFTDVNRNLSDTALTFLHRNAYAGGFDWRMRSASRNVSFDGNVIGSLVQGTASAIARTQRDATHLFQRVDAGRLGLDTTRTSLSGFAADVRAQKTGGGHWRGGGEGHVVTPGFEVNDVGFQLRSDAANGALFAGYEQFTPGRLTKSWSMWTNHWALWTLGGERIVTGSNLFEMMQFRNNWQLNSEQRYEYAALDRSALRGGPALYKPANALGSIRLKSDPSRAINLDLNLTGSREVGTGGSSVNAMATLTMRPTMRAELSLMPMVASNVNPWQFVDTVTVRGQTSYLTARLSQRTAALTARVNYSFTPNLSLQYYGQPFLSAGRYRDLRDIREPRARSFSERFRSFAPGAVRPSADGGTLLIDRDGAGAPPLAIDNPDFSTREFHSNAVLRWEYRPGSTLFVVWSQGRSNDDNPSAFDLSRDTHTLFGTPATNTLLVKFSYWMSR
jgi:hypothetical protein